MHPSRPIRRALNRHRTQFVALIAVATVAILVGLGTLALPSIAAQPTIPPQPTQPAQPTQPPQPTQPSQPTQPPQPTEPSEPTAPPTEPATEVPTEIPTEAPTEVPTGTPTEVPTEPPPPTDPPAPPPPRPTQPPPPPTPGDLDLDIDCELAAARDTGTPSPAPATPDDGWTLYACEIDLAAFGPVESLALRGETDTPGWRVILVDENAPNTPGLLDASNTRLELDDLEGEPTVTFLIGVNPSCTAFNMATIDLGLTGTRPGPNGATVEATGNVPLTVPSPPPPAVTLESLTFTTADDATRAAIAIGYENAPARCGWQLLVTLAPTDSGAIAIDQVNGPGPEGATAAIASGTVSILVPAPVDDATSGTIELALRIDSSGEDIDIETISIEAVTFP